MNRRAILPSVVLAFLMFAVPRVSYTQQDAREVLVKVAQTYQQANYYLEGHIEIEMEATTDGTRGDTAWKKGEVWKLERSFVTAIAKPDKMRGEINDPTNKIIMISNGQTTWTINSMSQENRYTLITNPTAFLRTPYNYEQIAERVTRATILREENVEIAGHRTSCLVVQALYEPFPDMTNWEASSRTFWIDKTRHVVVQEVSDARFLTNGVFMYPMIGPMKVIKQVTTIHTLRVSESLPDTLFVFTPPLGAQQVESLVKYPNLSGQAAPDFTLPDLKGEGVTLGKLRGKVVLLNFWATWCSPCVAELPTIEKLHQEFGGKGAVILGISDDHPETLQSFLTGHRYTFLTLFDEGRRVGKRYGVQGIPTTVVIDAQGTIRVHRVGSLDEAKLREALKQAGIE